MVAAIGERKTLAPENLIQVNCPVFPAKTRISACFELRDQVWRGEKPEVRKPCQVAMRSCKCPINAVLWRMIRTDADPYHSADPAKVVNFDSVDLEKIDRVLIIEKDIEKSPCSDAEKAHLRAVNDRTRAGKAAPRSAKAPKPAEPAPPAAPETPTVSAATSGDMMAAINAEMEKKE